MKCFRWFALGLYVLSAVTHAAGNPHDALKAAAELIQKGQFGYARTVLEPALIHPALPPTERSRGFYLRGFSFAAQGHVVSARKDYNRALEFNANNQAVLVALGALHAQGAGTVRNRTKAFELFDRAARLGSGQGQLFAGRARLLGEGTTYDVQAARELLESAAAQGEEDALRLLGASFRAPYADPAQPERAAHWYNKAADAGDLASQVALAHMLQKGELGEAQPRKACEMFAQSAELGSGAAHASLAHCWLRGTAQGKDAAKAKHHFERAAALGGVDGYLGLGYLYEAGEGVEQDLKRAASWYRRAAEAGSASGQLSYAHLLLARDDAEAEAEAVTWLARASQAGSPAAANTFAWVLATSRHQALRNGERAVQFAEYAVAQTPSAAYLDTLAAAYAETGRWGDAIAAQERAIAASAGQDEALVQRLARYRAEQPWRQ